MGRDTTLTLDTLSAPAYAGPCSIFACSLLLSTTDASSGLLLLAYVHHMDTGIVYSLSGLLTYIHTCNSTTRIYYYTCTVLLTDDV